MKAIAATATHIDLIIRFICALSSPSGRQTSR
jgi:hypothetical protein